MYIRFLLTLFFVSPWAMANNNVIYLDIHTNQKTTFVQPQLNFTTSAQIKEAIDSGIRLYIIAKANLVEPQSFWFDRKIEQQKITLEISYFSLGKHYKVKNLNTQKQVGFNDYSQLLKEMEKLLVFEFLSEKISGKSRIKLRVMLDKGALPVAMQLPVLFDSNWDINTKWHDQKVMDK